MKITAVFCDAGSTNLLAYYLKNKKIKFDCYASGAALKILPKLFPRKKINKTINKKITINKTLITTTSLNNEFEFRAKLNCLDKRINIISVIDHWVNYKSRFIHKNKFYYPNEIWVFDNYAKRLSKKIFRNTKIVNKKNYYLKNVSEKINNETKKKQILYICEGNRKIKNLITFEYKNIKKITSKFKKKFDNKYQLIIKLHPNSKSKALYQKVMKNFKNIKYKILRNTPVEKTLSYSEIIVGIRSYALYLSSQNQQKTFTLLTKKKMRNFIPYNKIKSL